MFIFAALYSKMNCHEKTSTLSVCAAHAGSPVVGFGSSYHQD